jgi:hypothetical protein
MLRSKADGRKDLAKSCWSRGPEIEEALYLLIGAAGSHFRMGILWAKRV